MENASKALLIAGAILLVIAIIAIAVGIVSSTRGTIGVAENQIDSITVQMHNKQFESYNKKKITGADAKELVMQVLAYNDSTKNKELKIYLYLVNLNGSDILIDPDSDVYYDSVDDNGVLGDPGQSSIKYGNTYNCTMTYSSKGVINNISLIEN
ncbi:MAG: hypothetical protein E7311_07225 [Clostridiales bacterium]|nr:hypothetical protein [Clostridiales bacterium]